MTRRLDHPSPEQDELDKILLPLHTIHCDKVSAYAPNTPKELVHSRPCTCGVANAQAAIFTWALKAALQQLDQYVPHAKTCEIQSDCMPNSFLVCTCDAPVLNKQLDELRNSFKAAFGQEEK